MPTAIFTYTIGALLTWLLALWFASPRKRQLLFLVVSYLFYASWGTQFLPALVLSSLVNYACGAYLRRSPTPRRLWIGLGFNIGVLVFFKYLPPLASSWVSQAGTAAQLAQIALPTGTSFWTFQAISYLLDLYREQDLDPTLLEFCLYMAFWPTVLSGPICRLPDLLPQLRQEQRPSWDEVVSGVQRICVGGLMVLAAQVLGAGLRPGEGVNGGFAKPAGSWGGLDIWCLAFGFGFQLFFDFAGYSHIVIGAARLFGIRLAENFNRPYLSSNPSIFWTRWHMSLSSWIRDYVFLPLAAARNATWWRNLSLLLSMVLFGLWHKGSPPFLCWGVYNGLLLVAHRQWQRLQRRWGWDVSGRLATGLAWMLTLVSVMLGWIFFRAQDLGQAFAMLGTALRPGAHARIALDPSLYLLTATVVVGYFGVVACAAALDRVAAPPIAAPAGPLHALRHLAHQVLSMLSRDRWVWVAPAAVVLIFYLFVVLRFHEAGATAFLYREF